MFACVSVRLYWQSYAVVLLGFMLMRWQDTHAVQCVHGALLLLHLKLFTVILIDLTAVADSM